MCLYYVTIIRFNGKSRFHNFYTKKKKTNNPPTKLEPINVIINPNTINDLAKLFM